MTARPSRPSHSWLGTEWRGRPNQRKRPRRRASKRADLEPVDEATHVGKVRVARHALARRPWKRSSAAGDGRAVAVRSTRGGPDRAASLKRPLRRRRAMPWKPEPSNQAHVVVSGGGDDAVGIGKSSAAQAPHLRLQHGRGHHGPLCAPVVPPENYRKAGPRRP